MTKLKLKNVNNSEVQEFILANEPVGKTYTSDRLAAFMDHEKENGKILEKAYPKKKLAVVEYILRRTSRTGILKVKAETIAKKVECSIQTVYNTVSELSKKSQILKTQCNNGAGGNKFYCFIDSTHINSKLIMETLLHMSKEDVEAYLKFHFTGANEEQNEEQNRGQNAPEKSASCVGNTESYDTKESSKRSKVIKKSLVIKHILKHKKSMYTGEVCKTSYVNSEIKETRKETKYLSPLQQEQYVDTFAKSTGQKALFGFINMLKDKFIAPILERSHVLSMAVGDESTVQEAIAAKEVLLNMSNRVLSGEKTYDEINSGNIVKIFRGALRERLKRLEDFTPLPQVEQPKAIKLYNWLEE